MEELGLEDLTMMNEIDWEHILDDVPEKFDFMQDTPCDVMPTKASVDSWMGELEELLMKDDDYRKEEEGELSNGFQVSDLLLNSEDRQPSDEPQVVDKNSPASSNSVATNFESNGETDNKSDDALEVTDADPHDPTSNKRKRQLRNRDAAMRSRERKKMYVKDLEMKSRYLEGECRRLGRLLQCCYAENQMLRVSLHSSSAFGAAMTKPESAVLLLESLLLGSLVWFMVNICLLLLPRLPLLNQVAAPLASVDRKDLGSAALRGKGTKTSKMWLSLSFMRSKRCRASKTKMKSCFDSHVLCI